MAETVLDRLAVRLKQAREARGLTQQVVFNDTTIHVARLESKRPDIKFTTLVALSKYYQVPLAELVAGLESLESNELAA